MRMYKRGKTTEEFLAATEAAGLSTNTDDYNKGGDWIRFYGKICGVPVDALFNTVNSRVIGRAEGTKFSTDDSLESKAWFIAILDLANTDE